jgi:DNA invertase Pin-like site-specific DNA recombinase
VQELLALIETGQVDVVIIYTLDRITRSIEDLQGLVKLFDRKQDPS